MKKIMLHSSLAAILLGLSGHAMADGSDINLSALIGKAGMVFEGTVENIEYVSHVGPYEEDRQIPYTYVTYKVNKVLMGKSEHQDSITLRYEGGLNDDGTIMLASHTPLFDVGDTDILFVSNKRLIDCPLVDCKQSRFRVLNDKIYTNGGRQLMLTPKNELRAGIEERRPEVFENKIGKYKLRFESLLGPGEEDPAKQLQRNPLAKGSVHLSKAQFSGLLGKSIKSQMTAQRLSMLSVIRSDNAADAPIPNHIKAGLPPAVK